MPRRKAVKARVILPEPKFKSEVLAKFINVVMHDGKKSVAYGIFYKAMDVVEQKTQENRIERILLSSSNLRMMVSM